VGFRLSLLIGTVLSALAGLGCASPAFREPVAREAEVRRLPPVELLDAGHRPTTLSEVVRGRPALVNLWATWCEACEREFEALNRLYGEVGERALVVGVAVGEPHEQVVGFANRRGLRYPLLVDEEFAFSDALGSSRVPTTLVLDRGGNVRFAGGELDRSALETFKAVLVPPR
jgi:thiol-disulfide isomerase/thioredoxin